MDTADSHSRSTSESQPSASLLATYLAHHDEPCPSCNYNLRGLTTPICPECRLPIKLGVQLSEPRTGMIIAALMGTMTSAAPAAALLLLVVVVSMYEGRWPPNEILWALLGVPLVVTIIMGSATIVLALPQGRRRFRALPHAKARQVVIWSWAGSVLSAGIFVAIIHHSVR